MVVVAMIRYRDLVARAERQADAVMNRDPPDNDPGREVEHLVPGVAAVRLPGVVGLKLRPEIFEEAILEGGIPGQRHPQPVQILPPLGNATPTVDWTSKSPKPLPAARVGVKSACPLLLTFEPVGTLNPMKAVTI